MKYHKNQQVVMTEDAIENYGEEYRDIIFVVTSCTNDTSCPAYDKTVYPMGLYSLKVKDSGEIFCSLYDWELKAI